MREPDEDGMASVLGLCMLSVMLLLGPVLLMIGRNNMEISRQFRLETRLHLIAEGGMERTAILAKENSAMYEDMATSQTKCVYEGMESEDALVKVYANKQGDKIVLISCAEYVEREDEHRMSPTYQAVHGYLKKKGENYVWAGWLSGFDRSCSTAFLVERD